MEKGAEKLSTLAKYPTIPSAPASSLKTKKSDTKVDKKRETKKLCVSDC